MFLLLFIGFLAAGSIHALKTGPRTKQRFAELMLVYSLVAPAVCWSIFFLGATYVHLADYAARGRGITFSLFLHVFSSHGLMAIALIALLVTYMPALRANRSGDGLD